MLYFFFYFSPLSPLASEANNYDSEQGVQLIQDLVQGTSVDKQAKLQTLKQKKAKLEQQITAVEQGMDSGYSSTQVHEHMYLVSDMSRQLLAHLREFLPKKGKKPQKIAILKI